MQLVSYITLSASFYCCSIFIQSHNFWLKNVEDCFLLIVFKWFSFSFFFYWFWLLLTCPFPSLDPARPPALHATIYFIFLSFAPLLVEVVSHPLPSSNVASFYMPSLFWCCLYLLCSVLIHVRFFSCHVVCMSNSKQKKKK